jgi:hypothetical protein
MVKGMLAPLEKTLQPLNNFLRNEYVTAVVALFVVLYASNVAPRLPDVVIDLFNNPIFRVFVLFLVAYIANKNPAVALLVSVAFVVTLNVINRQEAEEGFLDVIDTFNGGRKEKFTEHLTESPSESANACSLEGNWQNTCENAFKENDNSDGVLDECCNCASNDDLAKESEQYKTHCEPEPAPEEEGGQQRLVFRT